MLWDRLALGEPSLIAAPIATLQHKGPYPPWAAEFGIYLFVLDGTVMYIGRALRTSLGQRVRLQCLSFNDARWDEVIKNAATEVVVVPVPRNEWYLAASIEAALNVQHQPPKGKRVS